MVTSGYQAAHITGSGGLLVTGTSVSDAAALFVFEHLIGTTWLNSSGAKYYPANSMLWPGADSERVRGWLRHAVHREYESQTAKMVSVFVSIKHVHIKKKTQYRENGFHSSSFTLWWSGVHPGNTRSKTECTPDVKSGHRRAECLHTRLSTSCFWKERLEECRKTSETRTVTRAQDWTLEPRRQHNYVVTFME